MMSINLSTIAVVNITSSGYLCVNSGIRNSEVIKFLQNIDFTEKFFFFEIMYKMEKQLQNLMILKLKNKIFTMIK